MCSAFIFNPTRSLMSSPIFLTCPMLPPCSHTESSADMDRLHLIPLFQCKLEWIVGPMQQPTSSQPKHYFIPNLHVLSVHDWNIILLVSLAPILHHNQLRGTLSAFYPSQKTSKFDHYQHFSLITHTKSNIISCEALKFLFRNFGWRWNGEECG